MDSYTYNSYARYYDNKFPSDFKKSCDESAALREEYKKEMERKFPDAKPETPESKPLPLPLDEEILCPNIN
jgi:hypothetical protein